MTKDNLTTNASNEAENPAFLVGAVTAPKGKFVFVLKWAAVNL
jgi:hypothetical protein